MTRKYFIYKLLDENNNLLYVGQTSGIGSPNSRPKQHNYSQDWSSEISDIVVAQVPNKTVMDTYEIYLINKLKPKYNVTYNRKDEIPFDLPELPFKDISEFEEKIVKPKKETNKNDFIPTDEDIILAPGEKIPLLDYKLSAIKNKPYESYESVKYFIDETCYFTINNHHPIDDYSKTILSHIFYLSQQEETFNIKGSAVVRFPITSDTPLLLLQINRFGPEGWNGGESFPDFSLYSREKKMGYAGFYVGNYWSLKYFYIPEYPKPDGLQCCLDNHNEVLNAIYGGGGKYIRKETLISSIRMKPKGIEIRLPLTLTGYLHLLPE